MLKGRRVVVTIREARVSDYEALAVLENEIYTMHYEARKDAFRPRRPALEMEYFQQCLQDEDCQIFVAEENGHLVGQCFAARIRYQDHPVLRDGTVVKIEDICVTAGSRGKGIGHALFDRAVAYANEMGPTGWN